MKSIAYALSTVLLGTALSLAAIPAGAENVPPRGQPPFLGIQVDSVNLAQRTIVIGDRLCRLADHVVVHGPGGGSESLGAVRKGAWIGIKTDPTGAVSEIWILPNRQGPRD